MVFGRKLLRCQQRVATEKRNANSKSGLIGLEFVNYLLFDTCDLGLKGPEYICGEKLKNNVNDHRYRNIL